VKTRRKSRARQGHAGAVWVELYFAETREMNFLLVHGLRRLTDHKDWGSRVKSASPKEKSAWPGQGPVASAAGPGTHPGHLG